MQPGPDERLAGRRLALGDLVLVMREDQVDPAGVDVERRARGASCSSPSTRCASRAGPRPIAVSHEGSPGFGPFQSAKSRTSSLAYSSASTRSPTRICSGSSRASRPYAGQRRDPEEDRAVVGPVGVAALEQRLDQRHDVVDVLGRPRQDVGRRHPQRRRVGEERCELAVGQLPIVVPARGRAPDDLVVDVGDVHHPRHRVARASAGGGRAGRRTGSDGSCRRGPGRRPSGRSE